MDRAHIERAILSVSSPGTHLCHGDDALARKITREANIDVFELCKQHPTRLGFFASLPLPDVEGCLEEIDFALDHLGAVGFVVMSNAHGYYLGNDIFQPVFEKLDARKAILFIHPTQCHLIGQPGMDKPLNDYPAPMLEFIFDTTRTVCDLILKGTVTRFPHVSFIISHGGAAIPAVMERVVNFGSRILQQEHGLDLQQVKHIFSKQFYFDLAGFPFPDQIHGLLRVADHDRLLYGSDFPYTPGPTVEDSGRRLDLELSKMFDYYTIQKIYSDNARDLLSNHGFNP